MPTGRAPAFLIVCFRFIGDVLVTTPLAVSIKEAQPDATIDYLVFEGTETVLAKNPYVDKVITMQPGSRSFSRAASLWNNYDVAIATGVSDRMVIFSAIAGRKRVGLLYGIPQDRWKRLLLSRYSLYNDERHAVWNILSPLELLGIPAIPRTVIDYDDDDLRFATQRLPAGDFILMHPYSRNSCKYWPPEQWGKLARLVTEHLGVRVIFTTTPAASDRDMLREILSHAGSAAGTLPEPFTLNQLAAALAICSAYVGIDTVVTHIAAAVGAATVVLIGPTLTRYWAPFPSGCTEESPFAANKGIQRKGNVTVIQKDWPCVPCNRETCAISSRSKMECLEELAPQEVLGELLKSYNGKREKRQ